MEYQYTVPEYEKNQIKLQVKTVLFVYLLFKKIKTKLERQAEYNLNFKYIYADVQTAK